MKKAKMVYGASAVMMSGVMMVSMMSNVHAAQIQTTGVTLTKVIQAEDHVTAPNTSFTFSIANGQGTTKIENGKTVVVYGGVTGGAFFSTGEDTISFAPGDALSKNTQIQLDVSRFTTPGVYRYIITENEGNYDGMSYDTATYYLDVYVVNGAKGLEIQAATTLKAGETDAKQELVFTNGYETNNVTLKKIVAGNQADMNKKFRFTVTIHGDEGEMFTSNQMDAQGNVVTLASDEETIIELGHNETITFYGLSQEDTYTIVEDDYTQDGYVTTVNGEESLDASGDTANADAMVTFTNTKEVTTPTGIMTSIMPYIFMVLTALGLSVGFTSKRKWSHR